AAQLQPVVLELPHACLVVPAHPAEATPGLAGPKVVRPRAGVLRALHVDPPTQPGLNWHLPGNPHRYPYSHRSGATMTEPAPGVDFATLPAPAEGFVVPLFITVREVARSRDFYSRVLGGTVVLDENPCMVKLSN